MTLEGGGGNPISDVTDAVSGVLGTDGGGGGVLGAVSEITDPISEVLGTDGGGGGLLGAVEDIGSSVGSAVEDVGQSISQVGVEIDQGVNSAVPGGWTTVGTVALMVAAPYAAPYLGLEMAAGTVAAEYTAAEMAKQAAIAAARNAAINATSQLITTGNVDPNQVAKAGITGGVTGGLGSTLGAYGANPIVAGGLSGTAGGALNAAMNNRDIGTGALTGGIGGTVGGATTTLSRELGLDPYSAGALRGATSGATQAALNDKSIGTGALSGAIVGGVSSAANQLGNTIQNAVTDDKGNTLLGQVMGRVAGTEVRDMLNPATQAQRVLQPSTLANRAPLTPRAPFVPRAPVQRPMPQRTVLSGAPRVAQQTGVLQALPTSVGTSSPSQVAGFMPRMSPTGAPIYGNETSSSGLAGATGMPMMAATTDNKSDLSLPGGTAGIPFASSPNANTGYTSNMFPSSGLNASGLPAPLQAGLLQSQEMPQISDMQMQQLQQLNPNLLAQLTRNTPIMARNGGHIRGYAGGGLLDFPTSSYDRIIDLFKPAPEPKNSRVPYGNPTNQYLRPLERTHFVTNMADGGEPEHIPEFVTGTTGHYVKGRGDGQSDDIPAMLADGEYVFDADTVAQLGNGSSDAGAKLLDHFRESLREHKRSAPSDKIPHKANPLAYMKEALKRHKG
jgi:hypothetical protein